MTYSSSARSIRRRARSRSLSQHDELGDQRVVDADDLRPHGHAGVDAHAGAGGLAVGADRPGRRQEALARVLGVDPALDRMPGEADVLLRERERLPRGDQHLLAHEIEAGHELGHRVLDLDARVHLEEEVVPVAVEEALDRPGAPVADGPGRVHGDGADPLAQLRRDRGRRSLLDELLVAALNRAVALAQMDDGAVGVGEHLDLDVPGVLEEALHVDRVVGEVRLALAARRGQRALGLLGRADHLEPLASPAGGGLDRHGPAVLVPERDDLVGRLDRIGRPRDHGDSGLLHQPPCSHLRAHGLDRLRRRADPDETRFLDRAREGGVLGQEPVAGVDRLGAGALGRVEHALLVQVALGRRAGPEQVRLVRGGDVQRAPVGLRVDGDGGDLELAQRAEDADGDLPAIGDQDLGERRHEGAFSPLAARRRADRVRAYALAVTFADQLTVARAAAVPAVIVLFAWDFPNHDYWATALFALAMATDWVDGWWARRTGGTSDFGRLLDPVADKLLVMAALIMLVGDVLPAWMVAA